MMYQPYIQNERVAVVKYACHLPCFRVVWDIFPFYSNNHTHIHKSISSHLLLPFVTLKCAWSSSGGVMLSTWRIYVPRKKMTLCVYYSFACVWVCWRGLFLFFYLCDFFRERGNVIDGLSQFPARHWKVKVYIAHVLHSWIPLWI